MLTEKRRRKRATVALVEAPVSTDVAAAAPEIIDVARNEEPIMLPSNKVAGRTVEQARLPKELVFSAAGVKNVPVLGKRRHEVRTSYQESRTGRDP
jgi:hypothetical protein